MAGEYIQLMELRRIALLKEDEKTAAALMEAAEELIRTRAVSESEIQAAGYL